MRAEAHRAVTSRDQSRSESLTAQESTVQLETQLKALRQRLQDAEEGKLEARDTEEHTCLY